MPKLTQELARELFLYNPKTGALLWRNADRWHRRGDPVGRPTPKGFILSYHGKILYAHRMIWLRQTGDYPARLRHCNGDKLDNRWENLALMATQPYSAHRRRMRTPGSELPRPAGHPQPDQQQRLQRLFHYDPDTGAFTWRVSPDKHHRAGSRASRIMRGGVKLLVGTRAVSLPKLIWVYMTGETPPGPVRMRNKNRLDLRWENLYVLDPRERYVKPAPSITARAARHPQWKGVKHRAKALLEGT